MAYIISRTPLVQSHSQVKGVQTVANTKRENTKKAITPTITVIPSKILAKNPSVTKAASIKEMNDKKHVASKEAGEITSVAGASTNNTNGFVKRDGRQLKINGDVFKSIGVNRYNLLTTGGSPYIGCAGVFTDSDLTSWFSEIDAMGVTSVRLWLFQSFTKGGTDFARFDNVLSLAEQHGIKVIPVLENQWADCTEGGYKNTEWFASGYKSPYGSYSLSYKDYVTTVVSKYKNNKTIMLWQLFNEAETDHTILYSFAEEMSTYIKSLDRNHLVSLGTIGNGQKGAQESQYRTLHTIPSIDVVEYHDYQNETLPLPDYDNFNSLKVRFSDSITLDKPMIMGESGIKANCSDTNCYSPDKRAELFKAKIDAFFNRGGAAYLLWSYRDHYGSSGDPFDFAASDPLSNVLRSLSSSL